MSPDRYLGHGPSSRRSAKIRSCLDRGTHGTYRHRRCPGKAFGADRERPPIVALVVDASMVVAWFVIGQSTPHRRKVLARAGSETLHAPPLLQIELASALVKLAHRRKITPAAIGDIVTEFEALELVTARALPAARTTASTCRRYALSAYDAVYFELAMRLKRDEPRGSSRRARSICCSDRGVHCLPSGSERGLRN